MAFARPAACTTSTRIDKQDQVLVQVVAGTLCALRQAGTAAHAVLRLLIAPGGRHWPSAARSTRS